MQWIGTAGYGITVGENTVSFPLWLEETLVRDGTFGAHFQKVFLVVIVFAWWIHKDMELYFLLLHRHTDYLKAFIANLFI